jgi:hypothetical protein
MTIAMGSAEERLPGFANAWRLIGADLLLDGKVHRQM